MAKVEHVRTPFGAGVLLARRPGVDVIDLSFGTLYASAGIECGPIIPQSTKNTTMELNVAYEALENMRKLNLELECQQRNVSPVDHRCCSICLLEEPQTRTMAPQLHKLATKGRRVLQQASPCLLCGSPACRSHSSRDFRKEGIVVCLGCERLFTLQFVVDCMAAPSPQARRQQLDHMVDIYDRARLLLTYSCQFIEDVASQLEQATALQNQVGLTSSATGIVSGILGVAAAATILTPAGPSLLIASLLFGGSATAVQTGREVHNYYSEPNRLADRVLALNGMMESILKTVSILRDALLRDHVRTDGLDREDAFPEDLTQVISKHNGSVLAGLTVGRAGAAGVELTNLATYAEAGVLAGRNARFVSKTSTGLMQTARFARFAGGALSTATVVLETRFMMYTIQQINAGNPCEKADMLRKIKGGIDELPTSSKLDQECQGYLVGMSHRRRRMTEEEVVRLLIDASLLYNYNEQDEDEKEIVFVEPPDDDDTVDTTKSNASLLERIEMHKQTESLPSDSRASLIERINMYKQRGRNNKDNIPATNDSPDQVPLGAL